MATREEIVGAVDKHLASATRVGKRRRKQGDLAVSVRYSPRARRLHIELASGIAFIIPVSKVQGLAEAKPSVIREVQIVGKGFGLYWPSLDLDVSVPGLVAGSFGTQAWMSALARKAGQSRSVAKAEAARRNGRNGGRPRKQALR